MFSKRYMFLMVVLVALVATTFAQDTAKPKRASRPKKTVVNDASVPKATLSGVRYGKHERHILDFWQAESDSPTPLVFVIHGGGWSGGNKERVQRFADVQKLLDSRISVAAINYRLM
jgi:acetyl esterase/lipase